MLTRHSIPLSCWLILLAASCAVSKKATQTTAAVNSIRFLGQYIVPNNTGFQNTLVGGLSGIDYDAKSDQYYLVSDDRSDRNPARFYTAKVFISATGIDSVVFTGMSYLLQADGQPYPSNKMDKLRVPDPESMRYNPNKNTLVWSSEGDRIIKAKDTVLIDPAINVISTNGKYSGNFTLPGNLKMQAAETGPRQNGVLEGISFADDYKTLFASMEEPLYEDGPRADTIPNNAYIRIYRFDVRSGTCTAQYAYLLSPVAYPPVPANGFKVSGVSEILSTGSNQLLVVERSYSNGRLTSNIRVYAVDLNGATDISSVQLKGNTGFKPATKKLLLNMDELGIQTDNIEGVTFGPLLPNGHKTLLFVSDNNFAPTQKQQFLLFEVME